MGDNVASDQPEEPVTFRAPPVNEVAFSVQFQGEGMDEVAVLADYLPTIRPNFPNLQKHPALPPMAENFGHPPQSGPQFQIMQGPVGTRYWFLSEDETYLLQIQGDRFGLNWRRLEGSEEYPRYRTLRPDFENWYQEYEAVAVETLKTSLVPTWCELAYINHIDAQGAREGTHGPLSRILRALNPETTSVTLPPVEDTQVHQRFLISADDEPYARFYLSATPAFRTADASPIYVLSLLARGRPTGQSLGDIMAFFDVGHDLIVRGFAESTTEEMHELWGVARV